MAIIHVIEERDEVLKSIKKVMENNPSAQIKFAIIRYNPKIGIPSAFDYHSYPLQLICTLGKGSIIIRVLNVAAGTKNENSELLKEILDYFGFEFEDSDIFTKQQLHDDIIRLVYTKKDDANNLSII